ncbi:MAG: hypothetical protein RQ757_12035 [Pseudomonadales bacterium]|nr:hypothetical protein [Pseudomonadales bacterium]
MNLDQLQAILGIDELDEMPVPEQENIASSCTGTGEDQQLAGRLEEIEMAQRLGYLLCRCSWPPQIMVMTGTDFIYRCPRCKRLRDL